jgi:beta-glucosidase-like glycosyl hydrolase
MFQLGLFENPYVDPAKAKEMVGDEQSIAAGHLAQSRAMVLLKNDKSLLPVSSDKKIYVENVSKAFAAKYASVVEDPKQADVAVIRISTPAIVYPFGGGFGFGGGGGAGGGRGGRGGEGRPAEGRERRAPGAATVQTVLGNTLAYAGSANQAQLDAVLKLAGSGVPVVVCVDMDRPTILTEFID